MLIFKYLANLAALFKLTFRYEILDSFSTFRFLIPFGAGILTNIYGKPLIINCIFVSSVAILLSWLFTKNKYATGKYALRWMAGIPFYTAFWGIGCLLSWLTDAGNFHSHFSAFKEHTIIAIEASEPAAETKKGIRIFAKVKAIKNCENGFPSEVIW
ncbi:MAG: hypothetical protein IPI23_11870 [Bacteroidetes bacterium]|nr:hypothetical protein [Bacteroidota bacterium]